MPNANIATAERRPAKKKDRLQDVVAPSYNSFISPAFISRKSSCACGGGCPSCQATSGNLKVSQPNDAAEIEADHIADRVMRMAVDDAKPQSHLSNTPNAIHRKCNACENEEEDEVAENPVMRKEAFASAAPTPPPADTPPSIKNVINSGGRPLDFATRNFFEPRFGTDLSNVRIYTDSTAGQSARAINARAYTLGSNIVFGNGEYHPENASGKNLLAHELAHTVQQNDKIHRQDHGDGPRDAGVPPIAGVPEQEPETRVEDAAAAAARAEEELRQKRLFFDRLRAMSPSSDTTILTEVNTRFPAGTDDRWLADTILRNGPEPLWSLTDIIERRRRASANHWDPEPGNIEANLRWNTSTNTTGGAVASGTGAHSVRAFYFPGTSDRRALIIGGVHGSEPGGVEVVNHLLDIMRRPNAPMPHFSVIIIPELFSGNVRDTSRPVADRRASSGTVGSASSRARGGVENAPDPNRQFPAVGSNPAFNATLGCLVDSEQRCIEPENLILIDLINRFQPERVANVHGHSVPHATPARAATSTRSAVAARTAEENLLLEGGPSITTDPRRGRETEDDALARGMAIEANSRGVRVPGNFIGTPNQTTRYPTGTAPAMSRGVTFGQWGSQAAGSRPAMNIVLVETFGNTTSDTGSAAVRARRRTELMNLAEILRNFFLAP